jgi:hypothetical protein
MLAALLAAGGGTLAARSTEAVPHQAGGSYSVFMRMPHDPGLFLV